MLNPVYDLLPRMQWVTDSGICQTMSDFVYDKASDSLCCPAPNYWHAAGGLPTCTSPLPARLHPLLSSLRAH